MNNPFTVGHFNQIKVVYTKWSITLIYKYIIIIYRQIQYVQVTYIIQIRLFFEELTVHIPLEFILQ